MIELVDWIDLFRDRISWQAVIKAGMKFQVP
jgi:hypothetical protein